MAQASSTKAEVGIVKVVVGDVKAIGVDGVARSLQVGDKVYARETLETAANSLVQVQLSDGRMLDLGRDSKFALNDDVLANNHGATSVAPTDVATIQEQIATGADPQRAAGPTAAGDAPATGIVVDSGGGTPVIVGQANSYGNVGGASVGTGAAGLLTEILDLAPGLFPTTQTTLPILPVSIIGTPGNDTLFGNSANNILIGGKGNDILVGDLGADIYKWVSGDQGSGAAPAVDTVVGFTENPGDKLDLASILQGEHATVANLLSYLHFDKVGSDTVIEVKSSGAGPVDQKIVLQGVDLLSSGPGTFSDSQIIQQLLAQGKLQVDA